MYRFAPSPTGDMHIRNLRVALFNFICSQQTQKKFIIRIEDSDKAHNIEGKDQEILEILHLFGIFTLDEALEWFDIKSISKAPARFDMKKLRQLNREHIKLLDPLELSKFIGYSSKDIGELAKVYLEEASTINEIKVKIDTIFAIKTCGDFAEEFEILKEASKNSPYFKEFDEFKVHLGQISGLKGKSFFNPLRVLLTGAESGPSLSDIYPHIKNYLGEIIK